MVYGRHFCSFPPQDGQTFDRHLSYIHLWIQSLLKEDTFDLPLIRAVKHLTVTHP